MDVYSQGPQYIDVSVVGNKITVSASFVVCAVVRLIREFDIH